LSKIELIPLIIASSSLPMKNLHTLGKGCECSVVSWCCVNVFCSYIFQIFCAIKELRSRLPLVVAQGTESLFLIGSRYHMHFVRVTTVPSSCNDDTVVNKISHGIVVKMTTKIFKMQPLLAPRCKLIE
jgi:hypothetical protein